MGWEVRKSLVLLLTLAPNYSHISPCQKCRLLYQVSYSCSTAAKRSFDKSCITKPKYLQCYIDNLSQAVYGVSCVYVENLFKSPCLVCSSSFFFLYIDPISSWCHLTAPSCPPSLYSSFLFCMLKPFTYQEAVLACGVLFSPSQDIQCVFNSIHLAQSIRALFIALFLLGNGAICPVPSFQGDFTTLGTLRDAQLSFLGAILLSTIYLSSHLIPMITPAFGSAWSVLLGQKETGDPGRK